jgi:hypothetical protein
MKVLFALLLSLFWTPVFSAGVQPGKSNASVYIFMDTNYGAIVSRYNLKVEGVEMPQMHGYKYVALSMPPGQYLIESDRDGVGGTSLNLKVGEGERHYLFIDPVGFPRPKPILTVVPERRGLDGLGKSVELTIPEKSVALLLSKGIALAGPPGSAPMAAMSRPPVAAQPVSPQAQAEADRLSRAEAERQRLESQEAQRRQAEVERVRAQVEEAQRRQAEIERLRAEVEDARKKQAEVERLRAEVEEARKRQAEVDRLRAESEEARKKLAETQENLNRMTQQQAAQAAQAVQAAQPTSSASSPARTSSLGNRRALIIGNDTYQSVSKLANAREDARTIAASLADAGYQVTLRLDLNERAMKATLRTFVSQIEGGDEVLFFFAGHGVQLGAANYLLPTDVGGDSEAQVRDEGIQLQRILDDFSDRKAKFTLAMLDACRDNPFKSLGRAIGGRGLAPTTAATGQMVIFSAGTGQQALDKLSAADTHKNGLFTRVFVREMQKPGLSIDRIMKNVRNQVAELAKTVGHEQVPAIYDQVLGDFFFK